MRACFIAMAQSQSGSSSEMGASTGYPHASHVGGPGQLVREAQGRLAFGGERVLPHLVGRRIVDVAVHVDADVSTCALGRSLLATARGCPGTGEEHASSSSEWVPPAQPARRAAAPWAPLRNSISR
jgi:hypothetical protein